jgi:sortase B
MILGVLLTTIALTVILNYVREDADARDEYDRIRDRFPEISGPVNNNNESNDTNDNNDSNDINDNAGSDENNENIDEDDDHEAYEEEARALRELSLDELATMNGDFIGWINALSSIDYPVVRGRDNDRYINTTFFGNRNSAGTIFMDYRHPGGFDEHVVILYGHRTRDGSMFTALENYLDPDFMRRNPYISITKRDGSISNYTVFAAIVTDAWDTAYTIGVYDAEKAIDVFPDAPQNASQFLLLSTCTRGSDDTERLLVFAART